MFDKFKQLMQLKGLQDEIKKQKFEAEKEGTRVVIDGGFNIDPVKSSISNYCLSTILRRSRLCSLALCYMMVRR